MQNVRAIMQYEQRNTISRNLSILKFSMFRNVPFFSQVTLTELLWECFVKSSYTIARTFLHEFGQTDLPGVDQQNILAVDNSRGLRRVLLFALQIWNTFWIVDHELKWTGQQEDKDPVNDCEIGNCTKVYDKTVRPFQLKPSKIWLGIKLFGQITSVLSKMCKISVYFMQTWCQGFKRLLLIVCSEEETY